MQEKQEQEFSFKGFFVPFTTLKAIHWIIFIGLVVYFNSLFNGFVSDDFAQIVNNVSVHNVGNIGEFFLGSTFNNGSVGLAGLYYKPILTTSYAVIYSFFQTWTFPYHLFQLCLHIINATFLVILFKKLLKKEIGFAIALVFLLHPINNEAIVSIAALQESLFLFFGLSSLLIVQKTNLEIRENIIVTILLLLSLLSKETGIVFILVVPLLQKILRNKWVPVIYDSAITLGIYIFLRTGVAHIFFSQNQTFYYSLTRLSIAQRLINIPAIVYFYLRTFFYPVHLLIFQRWVVASISFQQFYLPLVIDILFFGILVGGGCWVYQFHKAQWRGYIFFFLWFVIGLLLHLQIIPLDYTVADRWFYFPIIGLLGMGGVALNIMFTKFQKIFWIFLVAFFLLLTVYSTRDFIRNSNWVDAATLYTHDVQFEPDNYEVQSALGIELYNQGKLQEARIHLLSSIRIYPTVQNWAALGLVYQKLHNIKAAKEALIKALSYKDDTFAYQTLIKIMLAYDTPQTAIPFIQMKLKSHSNDPLLWLYLAVEEYKLGNNNGALTAVKKSFELYPSGQSKYVYQQITDGKPINLIY